MISEPSPIVVGTEVVVCIPGNRFDGLSGQVVLIAAWDDGAPGAYHVSTSEGCHPFGIRALRPLWPAGVWPVLSKFAGDGD